MGSRVRLYIGVVVAALVLANLVVLLWLGPELVTTDVEKEQPEKGWDEDPELPEEPVHVPNFESDPVDDEGK